MGNFGPREVIWTWADSAKDVFAADLEGDGDMDVFTASYLDNTIAWHENLDGLGTFGAAHTITNGAQGAMAVFAADLDGDGDSDAVWAANAGDEIAWSEYLAGPGLFGPPQTITDLVDGPRSIFVADLDGDGDLDVLSGSTNDDKLAWYENINGWFDPQQEHVITEEADGPWGVFAADLNGDLTNDALSTSAWADEVVWYPYGPLATSTWYCGTEVNPDTFTVVEDWVLGGTFVGSVTATGNNVAAFLVGYSAQAVIPSPWGEILVDPTSMDLLGTMNMAFGDPAIIMIPVPSDPGFAGFVVHTQGVGFGEAITLTCAFSGTLGF